jgi:prefoldin subunit 5
MDELRQAVQALAAEAQNLERQMSVMGDVPSRDQLEALQKGIDSIQRDLNGMQTAMDTWSEKFSPGVCGAACSVAVSPSLCASAGQGHHLS